MSKFYFLLICLFSLGFLSAQEKLTKEEKARRDKNIQAGNPFAKFGSKVKIATLSKGKYLEFHDLDSIVIIGTIRWHVYKNKIVGDIIIDSINPDARPIGDAAGLWISPDPLSEEFPSWSPYSFSFNNPIRFVDPDGRAAMDPRIIFVNGHLMFGKYKAGKAYWLDAKNSRSFIEGATNFVNPKALNMQQTFIEHNPDWSSTAESRFKDGYNYAMTNYSILTENMNKDKDSFNFVTHSMGTAFGEGIASFMSKMGWKTDNMIHINAFQAADIKTLESKTIMRDETKTIDYQNTNDPVIKYFPSASPGDINGADMKIRENSKQSLDCIHAGPIAKGLKFWNELYKSVKSNE